MSVTETAASLRDLAEQSGAWPFEEARKIVARLQEKAEGRGDLRDRLRPFRPAAYRHFRRGGAHLDGAPRLPRADRGQGQDAADRLLRRHGRPAQGSRQRAQQGYAGAASRQAAHQGARSVRRISELRPAQQCAAAQVPRPFRLRLRVHVVDRLLHVGPLRRGADEGAGALRQGDGDHAAVACARSAPATYSPFLPIDPKTGIVLQVPVIAHDAKAGTITYEDPETKAAGDHAGHRRALQAAMEAGLGHALGRARHRLRDGRQGPDRFGQAVGRNLQARSAAGRRKASITSCSSTRTARRFPSRRATGSPSTNGCATPRRRACRCSCIASRRRPSGSISTSSRARSTSISNCSTAISARTRASACRIRSGTSIPAIRRRWKCRCRSPCC